MSRGKGVKGRARRRVEGRPERRAKEGPERRVKVGLKRRAKEEPRRGQGGSRGGRTRGQVLEIVEKNNVSDLVWGYAKLSAISVLICVKYSVKGTLPWQTASKEWIFGVG